MLLQLRLLNKKNMAIRWGSNGTTVRASFVKLDQPVQQLQKNRPEHRHWQPINLIGPPSFSYERKVR